MPPKLPTRISTIPSWDKVIQRYLLSSHHRLDEQILPLIGELTDPNLELGQLIQKICVNLPKFSSMKVIIFVNANNNAQTIFDSSCGNRHTNLIINEPEIVNLLKSKRTNTKKLNKSISYAGSHRMIKSINVRLLSGNSRQNLVMLVGSVKNNIESDEQHFLRFLGNLVISREERTTYSVQIAKEKQRLINLAQHLAEGMAIFDKDLNVILWNRPFQLITGVSANEATGKNYREVLNRTENDRWLDNFASEFLKNHAEYTFTEEFQIQNRFNQTKWLSVSGSFFSTKKSEIDQAVILARDISHLKLLEQRKTEFISIATHELRTPITAIKGYLSMLERERTKMSSSQQLYLSRATEANNRLVNLAENLLRASQVEEDRISINLQTVNLQPVIEKVIHDFSAKAESKGLLIECLEPEFLPLVIADPEKVEQVFANLIDNAIKYTQKGWIKINFLIQGSKKESDTIVTQIQDSGIGIKGKHFQEIFEKFRRTHRPDQAKESGAGLGLFIVKSFIEKQLGSITVQSKLGKGTTFSVKLPSAPNTKSN